MKKISPEEKIKRTELQIRREKRKFRHKNKGNKGIPKIYPKIYNPIIYENRHVIINAPEICNFQKNYNECLHFVEKIREWSKLGSKFFTKKFGKNPSDTLLIEFKNTKEISPPVALLVASAVSCLQHKENMQLGASFVDKWDDQIVHLLLDIGFFEMLGINVDRPQNTNTHKFEIIGFREFNRKRRIDEGGTNKISSEFTEKLDKLLSGKALPKDIYAGLVEAINNVFEHAYKNKHDDDRIWLSAFTNYANTELTVIVLDNGRGITESMRTDPWWVEFLGKRITRMTDKDFIKKVFREADKGRIGDENKTSTKENYRGNGIPNMLKVIKSAKSGSKLRIYSGRSSGFFDRYKTYTKKLSHDIMGTLVEFKIQL